MYLSVYLGFYDIEGSMVWMLYGNLIMYFGLFGVVGLKIEASAVFEGLDVVMESLVQGCTSKFCIRWNLVWHHYFHPRVMFTDL